MTPEARQIMIETIRNFPDDLEALVSGLSEADLHTHYLDGEWTVAQNVHHLADSHMNSVIRLKLALTEDIPTIRPYDQDAWAELPDSHAIPLASSLMILRGLHERWCILWDSLDEAQWQRRYLHPETGREATLERLLELYDEHCKAHIDQITRTLAAKA
jgi:hypothetical protein